MSLATAKAKKKKKLAEPTITLDQSMFAKNPFSNTDTIRCDREQYIAHLVKINGWSKGAELGVHKGRTFLFLLHSCPNLTMIGVDLWAAQPDNEGPENYVTSSHVANEARVRELAEDFGERAIIIKDWTHKAAEQVEDNSLDFVFIDADHSSEAVQNDVEMWWAKVKDTGWVLGHDISWPTIKVVADELLPGYIIGPDDLWGRAKCPELL